MGNFKSKKPRTGFNRPQASGGPVDRCWKEVYPGDLVKDDILAGMGLVVYVTPHEDCRDQIMVEAGSPESKDYFLPKDVKVKAFVRKVD